MLEASREGMWGLYSVLPNFQEHKDITDLKIPTLSGLFYPRMTNAKALDA